MSLMTTPPMMDDSLMQRLAMHFGIEFFDWKGRLCFAFKGQPGYDYAHYLCDIGVMDIWDSNFSYETVNGMFHSPLDDDRACTNNVGRQKPGTRCPLCGHSGIVHPGAYDYPACATCEEILAVKREKNR